MRAETREVLPGWIALAVAAAAAWLRTLDDAAAMGDAPGTMGMPLAPFLAMWVPMMAAMMLPAIAPVATLWSRAIVRAPGAVRRAVRLMLFAAGYLATWAGAGLVAFALARAAERGLDACACDGRVVASAILAVAGLYQLSPLREACLLKCRSPATVLALVSAGPAVLRDLRAGALHGAWCLGCCWALMAVLALVGLMNVAAMVALAVYIFVEKTTGLGIVAGRLAGVAMLVAAAVVAVR
ncbi:MAG: DUF2182 domain-containing protein [Steroidobacteraceae bacterium]